MISECISWDISPQIKILTHSNALLQYRLELERCKLHKAACRPTKCDVINDIKLFPTVYPRIYCCKFLMLSNQMSHYKSMCIRIHNIVLLLTSMISEAIVESCQSLRCWHSQSMIDLMPHFGSFSCYIVQIHCYVPHLLVADCWKGSETTIYSFYLPYSTLLCTLCPYLFQE